MKYFAAIAVIAVIGYLAFGYRSEVKPTNKVIDRAALTALEQQEITPYSFTKGMLEKYRDKFLANVSKAAALQINAQSPGVTALAEEFVPSFEKDILHLKGNVLIKQTKGDGTSADSNGILESSFGNDGVMTSSYICNGCNKKGEELEAGFMAPKAASKIFFSDPKNLNSFDGVANWSCEQLPLKPGIKSDGASFRCTQEDKIAFFRYLPKDEYFDSLRKFGNLQDGKQGEKERHGEKKEEPKIELPN